MLLLGAFAAAVLGLGLSAASMARHWRQLRGESVLSSQQAIAMRTIGAAAILLSLLLCLASSHPTMAVLVWIMQLALAAVVVALTLAAQRIER